jgi:hypothetical protein
MTLDEAIEHAGKEAERLEAVNCLDCANEHRQLYLWLKELKQLRELNMSVKKSETTDGYHTFGELYRHRAVLFSVICNQNKNLAWKSKLHSDGTMYDGMFIVGINTPEGVATYHCDVGPFWEYFDVEELPAAPVWDGHTPEIALERLLHFGKGEGIMEPVGENI